MFHPREIRVWSGLAYCRLRSVRATVLYRLLDGDRVGRRESILESLVELLFLLLALCAISIVIMRFAFRRKYHLDFLAHP
jgi:hypothetical protein